MRGGESWAPDWGFAFLFSAPALRLPLPSLFSPSRARTPFFPFADFEIDAGELPAARELYRRLLERTEHVKVVLAFAAFEANVAGDGARARALFEQGYATLKRASGGSSGGSSSGQAGPVLDSDAVEARQQRALLLEAWRAFESGAVEADLKAGGDASSTQPFLRAVEAKMPRMVRRRRAVWAGPPGGAGGAGGEEEYTDYFFPDDDVKPTHLKLLEAAARWKAGAGGGGRGGGGAASRALAASEGPRESGRGEEAEADENELDLDLGGGRGSGRAEAVVLSAILAGVKRGRGEEEEGGEGGGAAGAAAGAEGAAGVEEDENALDLEDAAPPPSVLPRPMLSLPPPTH